MKNKTRVSVSLLDPDWQSTPRRIQQLFPNHKVSGLYFDTRIDPFYVYFFDIKPALTEKQMTLLCMVYNPRPR